MEPHTANPNPGTYRLPRRESYWVREIASKLGISDQQVLNLIETGQLTAVNIGTASRKHWRIPVAEYEAFLQRRNSLKTE